MHNRTFWDYCPLIYVGRGYYPLNMEVIASFIMLTPAIVGSVFPVLQKNSLASQRAMSAKFLTGKTLPS